MAVGDQRLAQVEAARAGLFDHETRVAWSEFTNGAEGSLIKDDLVDTAVRPDEVQRMRTLLPPEDVRRRRRDFELWVGTINGPDCHDPAGDVDEGDGGGDIDRLIGSEREAEGGRRLFDRGLHIGGRFGVSGRIGRRIPTRRFHRRGLWLGSDTLFGEFNWLVCGAWRGRFRRRTLFACGRLRLPQLVFGPLVRGCRVAVASGDHDGKGTCAADE